VRDLEWWRDTLPLASGLRLLNDAARRTFHLYTDASSFALGGFWYEGDPADRDWKAHSVPQGQAFACPRSNNPDTASHTEALTSPHLQTHAWAPPMVVRLRRMLTKPMHPMVTQRHSPLISKPMPGHPPMVVRPRRMLTDKPLLARNRTMENPPRHASIGTTSTLPRSTQ